MDKGKKPSLDPINFRYKLEYLVGRRADSRLGNFLSPFLKAIKPIIVDRRGQSRFLIRLLFRQSHYKFVYKWVTDNLSRGDVVLDVGAGRFPYTLYQNVRAVFGIDLRSESDGYLGWRKDQVAAYNNCTNLFPIIANCEKLPFKDNSFNKIVMIETIEHIEKDDLAISELARVLKQNGRLLIASPNGDEVEKEINPYHLRHYTPNGLKLILEKHFDNVEIFLKFPNINLYLKQYSPKNFLIRVYWHHIYTIWYKLYGERHYSGGHTLAALSYNPRKNYDMKHAKYLI